MKDRLHQLLLGLLAQEPQVSRFKEETGRSLTKDAQSMGNLGTHGWWVYDLYGVRRLPFFDLNPPINKSKMLEAWLYTLLYQKVNRACKLWHKTN